MCQGLGKQTAALTSEEGCEAQSHTYSHLIFCGPGTLNCLEPVVTYQQTWICMQWTTAGTKDQQLCWGQGNDFLSAQQKRVSNAYFV